MNDITLEDGVIEATARDLSFILDLNGCKLSGSPAFRAATGRSMEAIITNGTLSAAITATGKVSLITDEGRVTAIVGTERYTDLARALTKAPDGATVYLLRDVTSGGSLSVPTRKSSCWIWAGIHTTSRLLFLSGMKATPTPADC